MENLSRQDVQNAVVSTDEKIVRVQGTRKRSDENLTGITPRGSKHEHQPTTVTKNIRTRSVRKRQNRNAVPQNKKEKRVVLDTNQTKRKRRFLPDILSIFNVRPPLEQETLHLERRGGVGNLFKEQDFLKNTKNARQKYFDIPDPYEEGESSDSTSGSEDEWGGLENYSDKERDEEWLGIEREYRTLQTDTTADPVPPPGERHLFLDTNSQLDVWCEEYMTSMKYFWWTLILGGRMPFQTYVEDRNIKFKLNKRSFQFLYFSLTSAFLAFCTTTMAYSFIRIFVVVERGTLNFYERVERLDVDKYWFYAVVTFAASAISSSWSLATIFEDGRVLADFLSRWNVAISALKYRPTARIRLYFWLNALAYISYSAIVIYLFETDYVPAVKGASGLIGLTILRPFAAEIRFSRNFPHVQRLGLFVHLYTVFSSRAILLMITLYCKLLVNMARKWNLRLAYVMGMLGETLTKDKVVAVISYQKLFLEHTIIVGFLRHTGRVFSTALGIFYSLKMFELLILTYSAVSLIIHPRPKFNETEVRGTPDYLQTIRYTDPVHLLIGTVILLLLHNLSQWIITTEQITTPGVAILDGFSFIRRWGLILSKTSQRRRFVQSINHAFSQQTDYYVRAGFTINREFTFNMFFWLATFGSLLIVFHPFQLQKEIITVCSEAGTCVAVSRTRIAWRSSGPGSSKEDIMASAMEVFVKSEEGLSTTIAALSTTELKTTRPTTTTTTTTVTTSTSTTTTTTMSTTTIPPLRSTNIINCPGVHSGKSVTIRHPRACFQDGSFFYPFHHTIDCLTQDNDHSITYALFIFNGRDPGINDCESPTERVLFVRDSCGNIPLNNVRTGKPATMKAIKIVNLSTSVNYVLCCYDYGFGPLDGRLDQYQYCNQLYTNSILQRCGIRSNVQHIPNLKYDDVSNEIKGCVDDLGPTTPNCERVNKCLCGDNRPTPNGPGGMITCP